MDTFLVDTHTHLCDKAFDADRTEVLERAQKAGISAVIGVSETLVDAQRNLELANIHPLLKPAAGLYPIHLDHAQAEATRELIRKEYHKLWAIGEVGLDYWKVKDDEGRELQREIFGSFINLSLALGLPLNVHSRSAGRHAIEFLLDRGAKNVQLHAFDAKASTALPAVEAGYFFSIPTSIVRSRQKQKLVKHLPLFCLLVETDSPVLAPSPQERNEPSNILVAIEAVAELKNVSKQEVIEVISENTRRLYGDLS